MASLAVVPQPNQRPVRSTVAVEYDILETVRLEGTKGHLPALGSLDRHHCVMNRYEETPDGILVTWMYCKQPSAKVVRAGQVFHPEATSYHHDIVSCVFTRDEDGRLAISALRQRP